ncbi:unnamed protein product [Pleuronectes platessa]|uniref:Uncharacterized protein n=1 Tax=Pleuronectes platessa TaxID=8262 RepID=A0A9N7TMK1_PLEPL|nr:unnamed protein product [Pleuronectes platessa]
MLMENLYRHSNQCSVTWAAVLGSGADPHWAPLRKVVPVGLTGQEEEEEEEEEWDARCSHTAHAHKSAKPTPGGRPLAVGSCHCYPGLFTPQPRIQKNTDLPRAEKERIASRLDVYCLSERMVSPLCAVRQTQALRAF